MVLRSGLRHVRSFCGHRTSTAINAWKLSASRHQQQRWINYGHDMHKEMLSGTPKISVTEYDDGGYVVNDVNMRGSVVLLSEIAMLWKPQTMAEITRESLELFTILNPPIEILLLGCGQSIQYQLAPSLKQYLKVHGIVVEYLDSVNACATFNILNAEDRKVAAAILPCTPSSRT